MSLNSYASTSGGATELPGYASPVGDSSDEETRTKATVIPTSSALPQSQSTLMTPTVSQSNGMDQIAAVPQAAATQVLTPVSETPVVAPIPVSATVAVAVPVVADDDGSSSSDESVASSASSDSVKSATFVDPAASLTAATATRRRRLPRDVIGILEDRIKRDGAYVPLQVYKDLISEYSRRGKLESTRDAYERALGAYPSVPSLWIAYAELEQSAGEFDKVDEIYRRALAAVTSLGLWQHYLTYVRRRNNVVTDGENARRVITQAFELVLGKVGIDVRAGKLWREFIDFVKSTPDGRSTWETQQKMDLLRKIFQRVICIPVENLESLWQEYNSFENKLNKLTARKILSDKAPFYMTARACLKELQQSTRDLSRDALPVKPRWRDNELAQVVQWQKWIDFERRDPLGFMNDDGKSGMPGGKEQVIQRVLYAFNQALQPLRFYPQMWFEASEYCSSVNLIDEQLSFLKDGTAANPGSSLLHFRLAEVYELAKKKEEAKKTYITLGASILAEIESVKLADEEKKDAILAKEGISNGGMTTQDDGAGAVPVATKYSAAVEKKLKAVDESSQKRIALLSKDLTLCNTMRMRAVKRMEGLKVARQVFAEARKQEYCTHHIFVASALMEYHHNGTTDIAKNIFEFGMRKFGDMLSFVEQYLDFLMMTNDDTIVRSLFERTVSRMSSADLRPLFRKFYAYEAAYGSELSAVSKLETRMLELYPDVKPIARFASRYTLGGHSIIGEREVGPAVYREIMKDDEVAEITGRSAAMELSEDDDDEELGPGSAAAHAAMALVAPQRASSLQPPQRSRRERKRMRDEGRVATSSAGGDREPRKRKRKRDKTTSAASTFSTLISASPNALPSQQQLMQQQMALQHEQQSLSQSQPPLPQLFTPSNSNSFGMPDSVMHFLSLLPPASSYNAVLFDPAAIARLLEQTDIPSYPPAHADITKFRQT
ncbi:uncharacterized protein V1518DRAFT_416202 [Limtongia smithiae]|uniref:uncharacterized protein n=1 Tax=Limtongia smithiae TaxID=1125753 RepID=UPI0034CE86C4